MPLAATWRHFVSANFGKFATVLTHVLTATENIFSVFSEGKVHPTTGHEGPQEGLDTYFYSFFNVGARWARVVNTTTRALYPRERSPVIIVQKAVWVPEPVIRCGKSRPRRDSMPETSSSQPVTILTALSLPEYILVTLIYVVIFSAVIYIRVPCQWVTLYETQQHGKRKVIPWHLPCFLQVTSGGAVGVGGGYPEAVSGPTSISSTSQTISGGTGVSSSYGPPGASGPY